MTEESPGPGSVEEPHRRSTLVGRVMFVVRYVVPGAIVLGGAIVMAFGGEVDLEGGAGIVSAGLAVYLVNWLYRVSVYGDREREHEEAARVYLARHGHWPDEGPARRGGRSAESGEGR